MPCNCDHLDISPEEKYLQEQQSRINKFYREHKLKSSVTNRILKHLENAIDVHNGLVELDLIESDFRFTGDNYKNLNDITVFLCDKTKDLDVNDEKLPEVIKYWIVEHRKADIKRNILEKINDI